MKGSIDLRTVSLHLIALLAACFALRPAPNAFGVVPPPDGAYPNFTTAEGQNALFSLTTGAANTAIGWFSLKSVNTGSFNTGVGAGTLVLNTGAENTAVGTAALLLNTASGNTAVGSRALLNNTTGGTLGNIQGFDLGPNVAVGEQALESNTVASANTAVGYQALQSFTTGPVTFEQLGNSTAVGFQALANATGSIGNSAFGYQALVNNTSGLLNTAVGTSALHNNDSGINNIAIGASAGFAVTTASRVICIGSTGVNESDTTWINNIYGTTTLVGTTQPVIVSQDGQLGTISSSRRFKKEINPMDKASESILALKPVTFRYKSDKTNASQFGLIAEEVAEVSPDLVLRDKQGEIYSVRYDQVNAMLLNEFLKEHARVEEQQATISQLKREMETVVARLKEQDFKIESVKVQIEVNAATSRVAAKEP